MLEGIRIKAALVTKDMADTENLDVELADLLGV